jgi:hypothetical protein
MSVLGFALGLVAIPWAGALAGVRLWPGRAKPLVLLAALAWPLGLALTSGAYFLWLVVSGGRAGAYVPLELAVLLGASALAWRARRSARFVLPRAPARRELGLGLVVLVVVGLVALTVVRTSAANPWGYWDAWARINLKARFLAAGGERWRWILQAPDVPHPDYPLLLECSVARLWRASALFASPTTALEFAPRAPQVLGVASWLACLAALAALTARLRTLELAALAVLALLAKRSDPWWAAMQYADFALATHYLWGAGLLVVALRRRRLAFAFAPLVAAAAASAAWCKNEGLPFAMLLLVLALLVAPRGTRLRWARGLAFGFVACGLAWLVHHLAFAGPSSIFGARTRSVLADLGDPARYRVLAEFAGQQLRAEWMGGALLVLLCAALLRPARPAPRAWPPLVLCVALALVYVLVLLTTREDLAWHVGTAADRLVLQLWPLAILGVVTASRAR